MSYSCSYHSSNWDDEQHRWIDFSFDLDENADNTIMVLNRFKELLKKTARELIVVGEDTGTADAIEVLRLTDRVKRAINDYLDEMDDLAKKEAESEEEVTEDD